MVDISYDTKNCWALLIMIHFGIDDVI
jgi:hypothetical protein